MAELENCIIHLIGFPGTGKYTVAKEVCKQANFKLVDNQLINQPVFSLIETDGKTKLPPKIWNNTKKIWRAVLDTIIHISPPKYNFIFTNMLLESDTEDRSWFQEVKSAAQEKNALFVPVRMLCSVEEMERRIVQPDRAARLKQTDPKAPARYAQNDAVLKIDHPNILELDVTDIAPQQAAEKILTHARSLR